MNLLSKIRVANTALTVPVEVHPCTFEDMVVWQRRIHAPFIAPSGGIGDDWDWPLLFLGCHVMEQAGGRRALAFQLRVENASGDGIPVAQAILQRGLSLAGRQEAAVCVRLVHRGGTAFGAGESGHRPAVFHPRAFAGYRGADFTGARIGRPHRGLHAAPGKTRRQGEQLAQRYRRLGLRQRSRRGWLPFFRFPHRTEDGRLFFFTPEDALAFAQKQDDLR